MNQDPIETRLRELNWRRELTEAERAEMRVWLEKHPDARADWEMDEQLSALLNRLPDTPVSSNFTTRVMQAVEREAILIERAQTKPGLWSLQKLLPRLAMATVVILVGLFAFQRHGAAQRAELVRSLVAVSQVESLPSTTLLKDFDAIRQMGRTPVVDEELLALMQ
jgi:anti-sigma factor RsiW